MSDVVVAIASYRRPKGLQRLLRAVACLDTQANVTVLVADNDSEKQEALAVCAKLSGENYRWPLDAFLVEERGIANTRNALVARALANHDCAFIAMIDDDEAPASNWLDELLRVQTDTGADVLNGKTRRVFEGHPGAWTVHCDGVSDTDGPTGPIAMLETTGNLLARRQFLETLSPPWFDKAFALSGGEDKDFFLRAKESGARFAWANDAVVLDFVPPSRANLKWALRRAYSVGNSDMRVFLKHRPGLAAKLNEYGRIGAALLLNPVLFVILAFNPNRRVRPLRKLCRAFGKLTAIGGRYYDEYSVIHGQ